MECHGDLMDYFPLRILNLKSLGWLWPWKSNLSLEWLDRSREVAEETNPPFPTNTEQFCLVSLKGPFKYKSTTTICKEPPKAFSFENESIISSHAPRPGNEPEIKTHGASLRVTTDSGDQKKPFYSWTLWASISEDPLLPHNSQNKEPSSQEAW